MAAAENPHIGNNRFLVVLFAICRIIIGLRGNA